MCTARGKKKTTTVSAFEFVRPFDDSPKAKFLARNGDLDFFLVAKAAEQVAKWRLGDRFFEPWEIEKRDCA